MTAVIEQEGFLMWTMGDKKIQAVGDDQNFTFLAKGVDFKGVVNSEGTIRIDGRLEGEVHTTGTLIVGEHAVIKGMVSACTAMISGRINGTVTATEKIQILKSAVFIGDIRTPAISIEEGAHFHGMCDMGAHKVVEIQPADDNDNKVYDLTRHRAKVGTTDL
jgi:cytoskeletal protein CcmA (bactofilin family)